MSNRINNLRFVSAALIAAGALALGIPAINAQSTNESPSTTGKIESGAGHAASGIGSAASSAASKATSLVTGKSDTNAEILSKLHESDQAEIGMGKLAVERATSPQVKSYGEMLIRDHAAADRKVTQVARNIGVQLKPPAAPTTELKNEANHDAAVREMLEGKKGKDFDWNFLQAMKDDHDKDIQEMSEAQNTTSNQQVKSLVQEVMPKLKEHRDRADSLLAQIKRPSGQAGAAAGASANTSTLTH